MKRRTQQKTNETKTKYTFLKNIACNNSFIYIYDMTKQVQINEHEVRNSTLSYRDTDYRRTLHTKDRSKERKAITHGMF